MLFGQVPEQDEDVVLSDMEAGTLTSKLRRRQALAHHPVTQKTPSHVMSFDSLYINSCLEKDQYEWFVRQHYPQWDIWETSGDELKQAINGLRLQVFSDLAERRYSVKRDLSRLARLSILFGATVATVAFVRSVLSSQSNTKSLLEYIGYAEGAFGLIFTIATQLISKQNQTHEEAAENLDDVFAWLDRYYEKKLQMPSTVSMFKPQRSVSAPIKDKLLAMDYRLLDVSPKNSLLNVISIIRRSLGFSQDTLECVQSAVDQRCSTEAQFGHFSMNDLAELYDSPMIVINELSAKHQRPFYQIFNKTAIPKDNSKEAEDPEQYQRMREKRCMMIYCNANNDYQPLFAPSLQHTFSMIQERLSSLNAHAADVSLHALKKSH